MGLCNAVSYRVSDGCIAHFGALVNETGLKCGETGCAASGPSRRLRSDSGRQTKFRTAMTRLETCDRRQKKGALATHARAIPGKGKEKGLRLYNQYRSVTPGSLPLAMLLLHNTRLRRTEAPSAGQLTSTDSRAMRNGASTCRFGAARAIADRREPGVRVLQMR